MKYLLRDSKGRASWSTTLVVAFFVLSVAAFVVSIAVPEPWSSRAAGVLPHVVACFIALVVGYVLRRGTEAKYNGDSAEHEDDGGP